MREETYLFVLRVMVGLVILYDHVHPVGAFQKSSNVDVSPTYTEIYRQSKECHSLKFQSLHL
jgi:hypothetical protein